MTTELSEVVRWRLEIFQLMTPWQRIVITEAVNTVVKLEDEGHQFILPYERDDIFKSTGYANIARACYKAERAGIPWLTS